MGTKATAESMMKLCSDFCNMTWDSGPKMHGSDRDKEYPKDVTKKLFDIIDKITEYTYDEARAEEIIKKVIERSKQDLINLIKEDEAFTKDEMMANQIVQNLKQYNRSGKMTPYSVYQLYKLIHELGTLLRKDADIAEAVQIVSRDLEKLMQTLQKAEK